MSRLYSPFSSKKTCPICGKWDGCRLKTDTSINYCIRTHDQHGAPEGWKFIGLNETRMWGRFAQAEQCVICRKYGDCKELKEANLWLCVNNRSQETAPDGWRFVGITKGSGDWAMFAPLDAAYVPNIMPMPRRKEAPEPERVGLSIVGMLLENRRIQNQLTLEEQDRQWLMSRIPDSGFISWLKPVSYRPDTIIQEVSHLHPNLNPKDRHRLRTISDTRHRQQGGILLPMPWITGDPAGFQVVPHERVACNLSGQEYDGKKYSWLTGTRLPRPYDTQPHGYFSPPGVRPDSKGTLAIMEGALKAAISAYLMQAPVYGSAAGGRFYSNQIEEVIREKGIRRVVLYPDSAMQDNAHVALAYHHNAQVMETLGIPMLVAYWGQNTKGQDIDEMLLRGESFRPELLSYDEFFHEVYDKEMRQRVDKSRDNRNLLSVTRREPGRKNQPDNVQEYRDHLRHEYQLNLQKVILGGKGGELHLFRYPTGTGKSVGLSKVIPDLKVSKMLPGRVLILVRTRKEAGELAQLLGRHAYYYEGRTDDKASNGYCAENSLISTLTGSRHNAFNLRCADCHAERQVLNWPCPYMDQNPSLRGYPVIIGTYQTFINESERLKDFDIIIVDESLEGANITEQIAITQADLDRYYETINTYHPGEYPEDSQVMQALKSIQEMLNICATLKGKPEAIDARTVWKVKPQAVLNEQWPEGEASDTFPFEMPRRGLVPKRVMVDLLAAFADDHTQIDLTGDGILFDRPFLGLKILKEKLVISLDATPLLPLLNDVWGFENVYTYGPEQPLVNVEITQCLGRLDRTVDLKRNPARLRELETLIGYYIRKHNLQAPLIVCPKACAPNSYADDEAPEPDTLLRIPHPGAMMIWWGGQTRASNDFLSCDGVIMIGNHEEPPHNIRRKVNAIRRSRAAMGDAVQVIKRMDLVGDAELIPGRKQWDYPDWLLQYVIDAKATGEIIQTIGRLRPLDKAEPVKAIIINDRMLPGVPIDTVDYRRDIIKQEMPDYIGRERPHLDAINEPKTQEAITKIENYLRDNLNASVREIAGATSTSTKTVQKYRNAIRERILGVSLIAEELYIEKSGMRNTLEIDFSQLRATGADEPLLDDFGFQIPPTATDFY